MVGQIIREFVVSPNVLATVCFNNVMLYKKFLRLSWDHKTRKCLLISRHLC